MEGIRRTHVLWTAVLVVLMAACGGTTGGSPPPLSERETTTTSGGVRTTTTASSSETSAAVAPPATSEELLAPVEAVRSSLAGWQEVAFTIVENPPEVHEGEVSCVQGQAGWSISTGTRSPLEAVGEWTRGDPIGETDIVFAVRSLAGQNYVSTTRILVGVSAFEGEEIATELITAFRSGLQETCGLREIEATIGGGAQDAVFTSSIEDGLIAGADESVSMVSSVTTGSGVLASNPPTMAFGRYGRFLISAATTDARQTGDPLTAIDFVELAAPALP